MKKNLALAVAVIVAGVTLAAPASAQVCQHDYYHPEICNWTAPPPDRAPDYSRGGYNGAPVYNSQYNNGGYYPQPSLFDALFWSLFRSRKPVACYDASGNLYLVRGKKPVPATGSQAVQIKRLAAVTTTCGDSTYSAVAMPETAPQAAPAPTTNTTPTFTRDGKNFYCRTEYGQEVCRSGN